MDLEARKISFVQEFLRLQNEEVITGLEEMLRKRKRELFEKEMTPMSKEQFEKQIALALKDSQSDNVVDAKILKDRIGSWT